MSKRFAEHSQSDLSEVNKEVLKMGWNSVFAKVWQNVKVSSFVFFEGPPSANGMPVFTM